MALKQSNISNFLQTVKQGVKPNLFEVKFSFPTGLSTAGGLDDVSTYMCKAAALPASNLGVIEVPFRGRTVKIAGDRTFDTWTVTFINDGDFVIRRAMEEWMAKINKHEGNTSDLVLPDTSARGYFQDLVVHQLERDGSEIRRKYKLVGAFPTNVSQIDLAYDSNDQIEDFTVEFQYQYWTLDGTGATTTGTVG
jgi:hypothetical protein